MRSGRGCVSVVREAATPQLVVQDVDEMSFRVALVVPHPPVLLPEVGGRDAEAVRETREALERARTALRDAAPEVLFLIGPHAPTLGDAFCVYEGPELSGSFASFGAPGTSLAVPAAPGAAGRLLEEVTRAGLAAQPTRTALDHGTLVPLWFLLRDWDGDVPGVVAIGASWASTGDHLTLGRAITSAAPSRSALVASGDLSHRLTPDAPYGFAPRGAEFDDRVLDILRSGHLSDLTRIPADLAEEAGNCGLRPLCALAGALGDGVSGEVLSYEGPFGVGYPVVLFRP